MKMMKNNILALILSASALTSCTVDEIDTFDSHNYLSFKSNTLSYTFTFDADNVTSSDFDIPVTYAGRYSDKDAVFAVSAVSDKSTAVEGVHYKMKSEDQQIVKAGTNDGVVKITLLRTDSMKTKTYTLKLAIRENSNFKPGPTDSITVSITDRLIKPNWWVYSPYDHYLGSYTATKLRLWLEFMGVTDGSDPFDKAPYIQWLDYGTGKFIYKNYKDSEVKPKIMEFRQWLITTKGNPIDENNKPVAETLGSF